MARLFVATSLTAHRQPERTQQLNVLANNQQSEFKKYARAALGNFTPADRKRAKSMEAPGVTVYTVLSAWHEHIEPLTLALHKKPPLTLQRGLAKYLAVTQQDAATRIQEFAAAHLQNTTMRCLENIYPITSKKGDEFAKQRRAAQKMLQQPASDIAAYTKRYLEAALCMHIAQTNSIAIYDPHASWFARKRFIWRMYRERQNKQKQQRQRLQYITRRQADLKRVHGGLLGHITDFNWDGATLSTLRHNYNKRIAALEKEDHANPLKSLEIFEEITRNFREVEARKIAARTENTNLAYMREIAQDVADTLIAFFDLSNAQKNELVLQLKEYRALTKEASDITAQQLPQPTVLKTVKSTH